MKPGRSLGAMAAIGLALAAAGCLDTTEPVQVVESRVAHAAPGAGAQLVHLDNVALGQLEPLQHAFFPVGLGRHEYRFESEGRVLSTSVDHQADITAVILMNAAEPALRTFTLDRVLDGARVAVIHGVEDRAEAMTLELDGGESSVTVEPGGAGVIDPGTGTFQLRVHFGDPASGAPLSPITLRLGDNGFLVILAHPSEPGGYFHLLF